MATHPSILAWRIPWTEEPGRLQFMGPQSRTRLSDPHTHTHTHTHTCKVDEKESLLYFGCWKLAGVGGGLLFKGQLSLTDNQWARAFIGWGRGLHAETAQSALKLVIGGLTSIILIVLSTLKLQFQGEFISISEVSSWNCGHLYHDYSLVIT